MEFGSELVIFTIRLFSAYFPFTRRLLSVFRRTLFSYSESMRGITY